MKHTVSIAISTLKKLFITDKSLDSIKVVLTSTSDATKTKTTTLSLETYTCNIDDVEPGSYTIKAHTIDSDGNIIGDELAGEVSVQDGITAPGQLVEPATWEGYQRLTLGPNDGVKEIEIPVLMHVNVS